MKKIEAFIRNEKVILVTNKLKEIGLASMFNNEGHGCGDQKGQIRIYRGQDYHEPFVPKSKLELYLDDQDVEPAIEAIRDEAFTGHFGDGIIGVLPVEFIVEIRTAIRSPNESPNQNQPDHTCAGQDSSTLD